MMLYTHVWRYLSVEFPKTITKLYPMKDTSNQTTYMIPANGPHTQMKPMYCICGIAKSNPRKIANWQNESSADIRNKRRCDRRDSFVGTGRSPSLSTSLVAAILSDLGWSRTFSQLIRIIEELVSLFAQKSFGAKIRSLVTVLFCDTGKPNTLPAVQNDRRGLM